MTTVRVAQGFFFHEVNGAAKYFLQFLLHFDHVPQASGSLWMETDQHIHIAVGAKVIPQNGAKQAEFHHLPAAAKLAYLSSGNR